MRIDELRIMVTGAASGLGKTFCERLHSQGARVAAVDVNREGLAALDASLGDERLVTVIADISQEADVARAFDEAEQRFGPLNGLINNAGIFRDGFLVRKKAGRVERMSHSDWRQVIDVDLTGPFLCTRELASRMVEKETRPGIVINISSISRHGNMGQSNYSAAKAGLVADTKLWAEELAGFGIRVVAIAPGFVKTPILEAMRPAILEMMLEEVPLKRAGLTDEIYRGVAFAVECDYFNGKCLDIDGGLSI